MTSSGSFHLHEDRQSNWGKPSARTIFFCHTWARRPTLPHPRLSQSHGLGKGTRHPGPRQRIISLQLLISPSEEMEGSDTLPNPRENWISRVNLKKAAADWKPGGERAPVSFPPNNDSGMSLRQGLHHYFLCWSCGKKPVSSLHGRKVPGRQRKPVTPPRKLIAAAAITL